MNIKKRLLLISVVIFSAICNVKGQQEFTMYHMPVLSQSAFLNSASVPEHKTSISLPVPSFFVGFNNSAISVKELMDKNGVVDINNFIDGLSENKNYIGVGANVDIFNVRVKAADNFFSFNTRFVTDVRMLYPKDLISIAAEQVEDGYSLSNLGVYGTSYLEFGLGFTRVVPDSKWTYGGRAKLLRGIANIQTESSDIEINISDADIYQYEVNAKMKINAAVGVDSDKVHNLEDLGNLEGFAEYRDVIKLNKGFAIDGGVTYQFSDKLSFGVALNNLGFINWKSYVRNYEIDTTFIYEGVTVELGVGDNIDSLITVQTDSIFGGYLDAVENGIDTTQNAYRTWMPTNIFISAHYQLTPKIKVTGSLYTEFFKGVSMGLVGGLNYSVSKSFDLTTSWWWFRKSSFNMGLGLVFKPGPVQFHLVMDNILPATFVKVSDAESNIDGLLLPYQIKNFNLRFGVNLVFGRIKSESRLPSQGLNKKKNGIRKNSYKPH